MGGLTTAPNPVEVSQTSDQWAFVRHNNGQATNVRVLRGTSMIEVFHKGEKILVDITDYKPLEIVER